MSVKIYVRNCKPSEMLKAAHQVHPAIPEQGWEMLDGLSYDLVKGLDNPYHRLSHEYRQIEQRIKEFRRLRNAVACAAMRPFDKQKWTVRASEFVNAEMDICTRRLAEIEKITTPTNLESLLASQLGNSGATGTLIPGSGLQIRVENEFMLELINQLYVIKSSWAAMDGIHYQALRYAYFSDAAKFLEHLSMQDRDVVCEVLREGAGEVIEVFANRITSAWCHPSDALQALKSRDGRRKAHSGYSLYNENGDEIPS